MINSKKIKDSEIPNLKLKDGSEIQFLCKPDWREDYFSAIKIISDDYTCGIAFDEEAYLEFIDKFLKLCPEKNKYVLKLISYEKDIENDAST